MSCPFVPTNSSCITFGLCQDTHDVKDSIKAKWRKDMLQTDVADPGRRRTGWMASLWR